MLHNNILFGFLPETVIVSGKEYPVNTDFRTWLYVGDVISSGIAPERCVPIMLKKCYKENIPENKFEAVNALIDFYKKAFPKYKKNGKGTGFSADFDGIVIFSGFMKNYGIDLSRENIHWYRFAPLLTELSDCLFSRILEIRGTDISRLNPENRKIYSRIKNAFSLPDTNSDTPDFAEELYSIF